MTIKQIAESTGKTPRAVRNWATKVGEKISAVKEKISASTSTYPADFNISETLEIIEAGMGKNARMIYEHNTQKEAPKETIESRVQRLETVMGSMITVMEGITRSLELMNKSSSPKQIAQRSRLEFNPRYEINKRVKDYAAANRLAHGSVWGKLYRELSYQLHTDIRERAEEAGLAPLEYIDSIGEMQALLEVSEFILK